MIERIKGTFDKVSFGIKSPARLTTTSGILLSGLQIIDGVQTLVGDRVLVKDQSNAVENGVYMVTISSWSRSLDTGSEIVVKNGAIVFIQEGIENEDTGWQLVTDGKIIIGLTPLIYSQFTGAGLIDVKDGIAKSGNTLFLSDTGIVPGTYGSLTVDNNGRAISGTNPTTLAGHGITNAVNKNGDTMSGNLTLPVLILTASNGTSPIQIVSSTTVTNLNSDFVDGFNASQIPLANTIPVTDQYGILSIPKQSYVKVYLSTTQTITRNIWTKINYQVAEFDHQNEFNLVNRNVVVKQNGVYGISGVFSLPRTSGMGNRLSLSIYKNGVELSRVCEVSYSGLFPLSVNFCELLSLVSGDAIEIFVMISNPASADLVSGQVFNKIKIAKLS